MTIAWGLMAVAGLWAGSACAQEVTDAQDAERPARDDIIITAARTIGAAVTEFLAQEHDVDGATS